MKSTNYRHLVLRYALILFCLSLTGCSFINNIPLVKLYREQSKLAEKTETHTQLDEKIAHQTPTIRSQRAINNQNAVYSSPRPSTIVKPKLQTTLESIEIITDSEHTDIIPPVTGQDLTNQTTYTVQLHDTLYSIAKAANISVTSLQQINDITESSQISVGQTLKLKTPKKAPPPKKQEIVKVKPVKKRPNPLKVVRKKIKQKNAKPIIKPKGWAWPTKGTIKNKYNPKKLGGKGIRIASHKNTPVKASQKGVIAYAGNNIRGYGNVVIIKHDNNLLSIYGFLSKTLVKKGQKVKKEQHIGNVGATPSKQSLLHFEIHKEGKHTNPIHYIGTR